MTPAVAMTIAGSDSGGGAGLQADLRTFTSYGVFGTCAITALTAQNTTAVLGVLPVPADFVVQQVEAVLSDLDVRAVKTGMLATAETVRAVAALASAGRLPHLVVDPGMVSSSGSRLLEEAAERAYVDDLLPHAHVLTPNLTEAEVLLQASIDTLTQQYEAARALGALGPQVVVVKGGHGTSADAVDVVWDGSSMWELRAPRINTVNNHGTGCTFAAATAAALAQGRPVDEALRAAKGFVHDAIAGAADWRLGAGHGPLDQAGWTRAVAAPLRPST